jgi:hypothetical protein
MRTWDAGVLRRSHDLTGLVRVEASLPRHLAFLHSLKPFLRVAKRLKSPTVSRRLSMPLVGELTVECRGRLGNRRWAAEVRLVRVLP